jgi:serine/threonine protein kinase/Tol biopolymer transport system component
VHWPNGCSRGEPEYLVSVVSISAGTRLGPYEIVAPIGAGGMGEVFKARDTRLDRIVAIKILPAEFASDANRRQRLHREAKLISQLNHPHICALYDTGSANGTDYLVMEYLDGHSLADHLTKGPLPLDEVLRKGIEIAEALDRAHRQGIVHRDLKPSNIMVTKSGVKLLDFGLARSITKDDHDETATKAHLTEEGAVLGTFQYMAPEQVEGRPADARADIFGLGAVLYEMVTGKPAFEGPSRASLISAILSKQPPALSSIQPRALEHVMQKCLEKDPERRWQSAWDVAEELRWIEQTSGEPIVTFRSEKRWSVAALIVMALIGVLVVAVYARRAERREAQPIRLMITPPPSWGFGSPTQRPFAVSPDGNHIAFMTYSLRLVQGQRLWVRRLSGTPKMLEGTHSARQPFWSADSQSIAFHDEGLIRKIDISGGTAETICEGSVDNGGTWGADGTILFANPGGVFRVHSDGGTPKRVFTPKAGIVHFDPVLLPDGHHYLLSSFDADRAGSVLLCSLDGDPERVLLRNATNATWLSSGHLLFARGETLMAQRFDLRRFEVSGEPVVVSDPLGVVRRETMNALFSASRDGRILALQPSLSTGVRLVQINWESDTVAELAGPDRIWYPAVSQDGSRVACMIEQANGDADIWTIDRARGVMMRMTTEPSHDTVPIWSPDGRWIAYSSDLDLYRIPADGGPRELLVKSQVPIYANDWSGDGQTILFTQATASGATDVKSLRLSDRTVTPVVATRFREHWARFSPDGEWIAYQSSESGGSQVYVQRLRDGAFKTRVSTTTGGQPEWSRDGKKIYYKPFFAVDVKLGNGVQVSTPRPMFQRFPNVFPFASTVLPDDSGVIARRGDDFSQSNQIEVLLNWTSKLP